MLSRFERLVESAVEGSVRRVFPTQLQPVQLAKAAARAMEESQVIGVYGPEVANRYEVLLHPEDLVRFADYRGTLSSELERYLTGYARDRGLRPVTSIQVSLQEDSSGHRGRARATARFADLAPERQAEIEDRLEGTRQLRLDAVRRDGEASTPDSAAAWLEDAGGLHFPLESESVMVRLGRALDNDVVLANQRVSRYHAQLRHEGAHWLVYDLDSTNGTFVDGERIGGEPRVLRAGSTLRLGDHDLLLRVEPAGIGA